MLAMVVVDSVTCEVVVVVSSAELSFFSIVHAVNRTKVRVSAAEIARIFFINSLLSKKIKAAITPPFDIIMSS